MAGHIAVKRTYAAAERIAHEKFSFRVGWLVGRVGHLNSEVFHLGKNFRSEMINFTSSSKIK